jgi:endonuclease/exonuclease/phosphatase family metal-dependent hydrolase
MRRASAGATLRVATFNVRGFYHPGDGANAWAHREALNLRTIQRLDADLIGFQEAQGGNLRVYHRALHDYHYVAWPENQVRPPHEWPAIFWRPDVLRPLESGGFWLSETPEIRSGSWDTDCIRSAAWVRFEHRVTGRRILHLNTHLDHISEQARVEGTMLILRRLADIGTTDDVAIVTADFNTVPGSATYQLFMEAGFTDAHVAAGNSDAPEKSFTYHGFEGSAFRGSNNPPSRIDWVLVRGAAVRSCEIVRDGEQPVWPSDHFPVVAEVIVGS